MLFRYSSQLTNRLHLPRASIGSDARVGGRTTRGKRLPRGIRSSFGQWTFRPDNHPVQCLPPHAQGDYQDLSRYRYAVDLLRIGLDPARPGPRTNLSTVRGAFPQRVLSAFIGVYRRPILLLPVPQFWRGLQGHHTRRPLCADRPSGAPNQQGAGAADTAARCKKR